MISDLPETIPDDFWEPFFGMLYEAEDRKREYGNGREHTQYYQGKADALRVVQVLLDPECIWSGDPKVKANVKAAR